LNRDILAAFIIKIEDQPLGKTKDNKPTTCEEENMYIGKETYLAECKELKGAEAKRLYKSLAQKILWLNSQCEEMMGRGFMEHEFVDTNNLDECRKTVKEYQSVMQKITRE
jgi:hypothetical protein